MVERMIVGLLARGHLLIEGVPGVAKTLAVRTLADVVGGSFARLQFTPDLMPGDITGTRVWRSSTERFDVELGPIFANLVLADEINRAPAKVQSALLEAMAEQQVSVAGTILPAADAVPGDGDPEPRGVRGRLPPARGPARPVPAQDRRALPQRPGGVHDPAADVGRRPPRGAGARPRAGAGAAARRRRPLRAPLRALLPGQPDAGHPHARALRPRPPRRARSSSASAPAPPSACWPPAGRWRCCAVAPTCCPPTSPTSPPT